MSTKNRCPRLSGTGLVSQSECLRNHGQCRQILAIQCLLCLFVCLFVCLLLLFVLFFKTSLTIYKTFRDSTGVGVGCSGSSFVSSSGSQSSEITKMYYFYIQIIKLTNCVTHLVQLIYVVRSCRSPDFSFQPVLHDWCNKGRGMYYPVCGMIHIKEPLLLIEKSSPCGGSGFLSRYLSGHLPCLTPYNPK